MIGLKEQTVKLRFSPVIQSRAKMELFAAMTPTTSQSITVNVKRGSLAKTVKCN